MMEENVWLGEVEDKGEHIYICKYLYCYYYDLRYFYYYYFEIEGNGRGERCDYYSQE